jgi:CubicO group peptidase (beta-lactamase class C family)
MRRFGLLSMAAQIPSPLQAGSQRLLPIPQATEQKMVPEVKVSPDLMSGDVDEGYGKVADVFRRNLSSGQEVGAAFAVYRDGRKIVDLWGGFRNGITQAPWQQDTLVNVFSTTKGVASLAVAVAASRALISYDAKVADYWPEFAQAGKDAITVRQLLAHQAGLSAIKPLLTLNDLAEPTRMSTKLAAQAPAWAPGTRHGYHGFTLGWYEGELIRRADPAGRTLGRFFADEIAEPLGLDFYIGLPTSVNRDRVAHLHPWSRPKLLLHLPPALVVASFNPFSLTARSAIVAKGINGTEPEHFNREELRVVEIPSGNGIGTARSIAKLYGSAATGGSEIGLTPGTLDDLKKPATPPTNGLRDKVLHVDTSYSLGFCKPIPEVTVFGSSDKVFGTPGIGGSFGFADPDTGIGYAYVMNKLGFHLVDPRESGLRNALFHDVLGARPQT